MTNNHTFGFVHKDYTKELDEKYQNEAPKREDIDIFTYTRKIERDKNKKNNK